MNATPPAPDRHLTSAAVDALLLDTTPWLSCEDCFDRMDRYVESLTDDAAPTDPAMAAHLLGCPACAEEADTLLSLVSEPAP